MTDGSDGRGKTTESIGHVQPGFLGIVGRITNNFIHDMSTGTWAACLLVIAVLDAHTRGLPADDLALLGGVSADIFWLLVGSLVALSITGTFRLFYWRLEASPDTIRPKRWALVSKHVGFVLVYGLGTVWAAMTVFGAR